ncbi:MAG: Ig-like domain-containing protein [Candidatus Marinimicrobia bacterium]|nr:Ig-like domain-containing protein [Candidatus Neomarinimicrobiota bacterium]
MTLPITRLLALFLALLGLVGCELPTNGSNGPRAAAVTISPEQLNIAIGETLQLQVAVLGEDGLPLANPSIKWSVAAPAILTLIDEGLVQGNGEGETVVRATVGDSFGEAEVRVADALLLGEATLENQTDHSALMVSWLPVSEPQRFGGESTGYVATDIRGTYALPRLEDGDWVVTAEYPYYALARDTITVSEGRPAQPLRALHLTQQLAFEVVLERTEFAVDDTIWVAFKATNLTNDTLIVVSRTRPITYGGYALAEEGELVLVDGGDRGLAGYVFGGGGQPAFDGRVLPPGHTQLETAVYEIPSFNPIIELDWLFEAGVIEKGKTYQVFAGYVADWTYPVNFFGGDLNDNGLHNGFFTRSLYKRLVPALINIAE